MSRVLVTGGAGFLGSHLCDRLVNAGHEVHCVDNLYTGSIKNIAHLEHCKNFTFSEHDIEIPLNLSVDEIYNLACPASPPNYQKDPIKTTRTSVIGAMNMLELAKKNNAKILQASTSEVYGDPSVHPQPESYWGNVNPAGIRSCYDEGKRCAESLFFDYHRQFLTRIKVVRIFNTYGPRMDAQDGRVVSNFIVQQLSDLPNSIYGDGSQTRSFCYVSDLIEAMIRMMHTPDDVLGPVNIGNPHEFTMLALSSTIAKLLDKPHAVEYKALPKDDPKQRCPNIDLAHSLLDGWKPEVQLEEGLRQTIQYFRSVV